MRHIPGLFSTAVIAGALLTACNSVEQKNGNATKPVASAPSAPSGPSAPAIYADGVRRVTPIELQSMIAKGEAFVLDVRSQDAFNTAHIKGAKLIPDADVGKRSDELPKDKLIVTYCS